MIKPARIPAAKPGSRQRATRGRQRSQFFEPPWDAERLRDRQGLSLAFGSANKF
jgi:hypothetical protein